ncbi:MAG: fumarate hydratase [Deltaproteobacteria bacterium]|jgi:fumarate hydratase subunit alpha|nr:fumarate hydratase [Deltaproteobacteria bacterium]
MPTKRAISTQIIAEEVKKLFLTTAFVLPEKVRSRLLNAFNSEPSPQGRAALERLLENALIAAQTSTPLCQDTGLAQVIIELGQEVSLEGAPLSQAVEAGVREAYETGYLRKSTCHPLTRQNNGDNTPASLETLILEGDLVKILTLAKGGGCDNKSLMTVLPPTSDRQTLIQTVLSMVQKAGPDSCPPFCLGLCIGGSFESAPRLARRALIDLWEEPLMTYEENQLADELMAVINATGIGPLGLGGKTTALGLRVKIYPTHLASLPLALCVNCHSLRTARVVI